MAVTFDDQTKYQTKQACEEYTEKKADLVISVLEKYNAPGSIYYDCKQEKEEYI